jgi:hypothetical protein
MKKMKLLKKTTIICFTIRIIHHPHPWNLIFLLFRRYVLSSWLDESCFIMYSTSVRIRLYGLEQEHPVESLEGTWLFLVTTRKIMPYGTLLIKQRQLGKPFINLVRHQDKKFYTVQGVKPSYTNWNSGEPNSPQQEHCGQLLVHHNGRWNDVSCHSKYHYICQIQLIKRK